MAVVVTGIAAPGRAGALEAALRDAGFSLDHLSVVEPGDGPSAIAPHGVVTRSNIGPIETGTGVPGLSSGTTIVPGAQFFPDDAAGDQFADFGIPDDEVQNYRDALLAGRIVAGYFTDAESVERVEAAFRAAGFARVKRF